MCKKYIVLVLVLTYWISSCSPKDLTNSTIKIPNLNVDKQNIASLVNFTRFKPLEGTPNQVPFEADRIDFSDELVVIGDFTYSQSIYAFDNQSGKALEIPLKKGEGPEEVLAVNDFWIDEDIIYVLDGIGRKIIPLSYVSGSFQQLKPISLDIPLRRFAKTKTGFVGLTGGGQEQALAFLSESGKLISTHLPNTIEFLMSPSNPFHKLKGENGTQVLFHTAFSPEILNVENGKIELYTAMEFEGNLVQKPAKTDFVMDQEGFNQFRETLINQPSFFTLFETTPDQFVLVYFIQNSPRLAISSKDKGNSFKIENLKNDLSFDNQPFPKVVGVHESRFVALVNTDQLNQDDPEFSESDLAKAMKAHPEAQVFLLEFDLK